MQGVHPEDAMAWIANLDSGWMPSAEKRYVEGQWRKKGTATWNMRIA
jgi:hypothetical protein